jgi:hypothetical protein
MHVDLICSRFRSKEQKKEGTKNKKNNNNKCPKLLMAIWRTQQKRNEKQQSLRNGTYVLRIKHNASKPVSQQANMTVHHSSSSSSSSNNNNKKVAVALQL